MAKHFLTNAITYIFHFSEKQHIMKNIPFLIKSNAGNTSSVTFDLKINVITLGKL